MLEHAERILGPSFAVFVRELGRFGCERGTPALLVGGFVRDLLLNAVSPDIDFTVEGDAAAFAGALRGSWRKLFPAIERPVRIAAFPRYGTVKLIFEHDVFPGVKQLDLASARRERYPVPGGRPEVERGSLREDLARRDFSVNAMALSIAPGSFNELVDLFSAKEDLAAGRLRVLHDLSFVDDPVRLIRAARFSARLGFVLEERTAELFVQAAAGRFLDSVSRPRVFDELRKALCEAAPLEAAVMMEQMQILRQIHPRLAPPACPLVRSWMSKKSWAERFASLSAGLSDAEFAEALSAFGVPKKEREVFSGARRSLCAARAENNVSGRQ